MARLNPFAKATTSLQHTWQAAIDDHVVAATWSPDGATLAAAAVGGPIHLFEAATGRSIHVLPGHGFGTTAVGWSASGESFASTGQDGKVRFWDVQAGKEVRNVPGGAAWVERMAWCPVADLLATAAGKKLRLWNGAAELLREYADQPNTIADVQWKPGDRVFATAAYGQLSMWSPEQAQPVQRFEWKGSMLVLAWSPNGAIVATGDQDATVHFWTLRTGEDLEMAGYPTKVRELSWDSTSRYLATGGGPAACVWDCSGKGPAGTTPLQFEAHPQRVTALAFQRSGPLLASAGTEGQVALWHPGKQLGTLALTKLEAPISQLTWSPDDSQLAVGTEAGGVAVFAVRRN